LDLITLILGEIGDGMDKINLLLIDRMNEVKNEIEEILLNVEYIQFVGIARDTIEASEFIEMKYIDVVLINSGMDDKGYEISEKLSMEYPELAIIILEDELEEETIHKAFFAGSKDIIIKPINPSNLIDSIYKANQITKKKAVIHKESSVKSKKKSKLGQVITVFSTKGGVGRTFIATNLAIVLARRNKEERAVLVDLDLENGNIALALNILPRYTVSDIVDDIRNINQEDIESYLTPHESGLWVLPANSHPMMNEFINSEHIDIIIRILQNTFDYVIIDMPGRFCETVNPAISSADYLLMIVTPEISAIRNIKAALISLNQLNYPKSKIKLVLNKAERNEIKFKDIASILNYNIFAMLTADHRRAVSTMNMGIPFVVKNPHSGLSKDINNMVKKMFSPS
jgi:pilus assembly protein CpaE